MFATRLIRQSDALLMLETFAFLVRRYGLPKRPTVPSPIQYQPGIDTLIFDCARDYDLFEWARDSLALILHATDMAAEPFSLKASREAYPDQPDMLSFDPMKVSEPGHFTARIILELAEKHLEGFEPNAPLNSYQSVLIRLAACAFLRQGFVMTRCLPAIGLELMDHDVPNRFIENALVAGACLALTLQRQAPEQMLATYGTVMTRSVRRKIRPACRQLDEFETEVKLLRLLPRADSVDDYPSTAFTGSVTPQPQRISWT